MNSRNIADPVRRHGGAKNRARGVRTIQSLTTKQLAPLHADETESGGDHWSLGTRLVVIGVLSVALWVGIIALIV